MKTYPDQIIGFQNNYLIFRDSSRLAFDDNLKKNADALLTNPDIQDQAAYPYKPGLPEAAVAKNNDPGRIRNEPFFKKMYGESEAAVRKNLVEIRWCPQLANQRFLVTTVNGVNKKLDSISRALDSLPELKPYVANIGGTFNWRKISGANRMSAHSFGTAIDINVSYSNYWQWDCKCTNENTDLKSKNRIPQKLIDIFERYGFIWGGKWYHYDTMHFEYRPDLL